MDDYVIWVPEYDGHKPPFWVDGNYWASRPFPKDGRSEFGRPGWFKLIEYRVLSCATIDAEAITPPFDADAWLAQGRANADKLPNGVVLPYRPD